MLKKLKELFKDVGIYGFTSVAGQIIGFLLLPLYTSYLTPADYGVLAMVSIIRLLFIPVGNLGLKSATMRFVSKADSALEEKGAFTTTYLSALISCTLLFTLCIAFSPFISDLFLDDSSLYHLVAITLLTAWLSSTAFIPNAYLRIKRKIFTASIAGLIDLVITISMTILLVVYYELGVLGAVAGPLVGSLCRKLFFVYHMPKPNLRLFNKKKLRTYLKYSLPYVPHYLQGIALAMFGQYMVKEMLSMEQAGLYNIAWRFCLPLTFIVQAFNWSWGPYQFSIQKNDPDAKNSFRTFFSIYLAGISVFFLGIALYGGYVLRFVVQENFHEAGVLIPFLALIPLTKGVYNMLSTGTYYTSSPKYLPLISFSGLVTLVVFAYWLVPILGAGGAGIATTLGYLVMAILVFFYAQKIYYVPYDWRVVIPIGLFVVAIIALNTTTNFIEGLTFLLRTALLISFLIFIVTIFYTSKTEKKRLVHFGLALGKKLNIVK